MDGSRDAGLGEDGPPPPPPADVLVGRAVGSGRRSKGRPVRIALVVGIVGLVAGLGFAATVSAPDLPWRGSTVTQSERDAALVELLEGIVASESIMLRFNDEVAERLANSTGETQALLEAEALRGVAEVAAAGAEGLRAARPSLVAQTGDGAVDDVRTAYVPHLDSWIEYLAALAERPLLLFYADDQQPYLLLINATAEAFAESLELLLADGPSPAVAELAERILDDGFRSEREAAL